MTHTYEWMDGWIQFVRNGDPFFFCKTKKTSEINRKEKKTSSINHEWFSLSYFRREELLYSLFRIIERNCLSNF